MVEFKECPRCMGDVQKVRDWYGEYINCLQCGHSMEIHKPKKQVDWTKLRQKPGRPRRRIETVA